MLVPTWLHFGANFLLFCHPKSTKFVSWRRLGGVLERLGGVLERLGIILGGLAASPRRLGASRKRLGASWSCLGVSWAGGLDWSVGTIVAWFDTEASADWKVIGKD